MKKELVVPSHENLLTDESRIHGSAEFVVFPESVLEINNILQDIKSVTVQGANTGLVGGSVPNDTCIINMSKLNKISDINLEEQTVYVEAGATLEEINKKAAKEGLFFSINPTEKTATIGGMFSTNSKGPSSIKYGTISNYIDSLDIAFLNGEVRHIKKGECLINKNDISVSNDDLEILNTLNLCLYDNEKDIDIIEALSGCSGKVGVITGFNLKLVKIPNDVWGILFFFTSLKQCSEFYEKLKLINGVDMISALEFYNDKCLNFLDEHRQNTLLKDLPSFPNQINNCLFVEVSGESECTIEVLTELLSIFDEVGGEEINTWAENGIESIRKFHDMRHAVPSLLNEQLELFQNDYRLETDFSISNRILKADKYFERIEELARKYEINPIIYGHIENNEFHLAFLPTTQTEVEEAVNFIDELSNFVIENKGKLVSSYGIGLANKKWLKKYINMEKVESFFINLSTLGTNDTRKDA